MRFPKAQAGVSKLFTAEILLLIAAACGIIGGIGIFVSPTLLLIFGIIAVILMIIAYIMQLVGLGQAQKDDNYFRIAFIAAIVSLVLSIVSGIFTANATLTSIFTLITNIAGVCVTLFAILGIRSVAEQLGDEKLVHKANRQLWLIVIIYAIGFIVAFIGGILRANEATLVIAGILSIIGSIIQIIAFILFILLLKHAKESFKA